MIEPGASHLFIVYDGRARSLDTDEAVVYVTADTLNEARRYVRRTFPDGVIFKYRIDGHELVDEEFVE